MEFNYFKVSVKHDTGNAHIYVSAISEESASTIVQSAEGCPPNAIKSINKVTKKQFDNRNNPKK